MVAATASACTARSDAQPCPMPCTGILLWSSGMRQSQYASKVEGTIFLLGRLPPQGPPECGPCEPQKALIRRYDAKPEMEPKYPPPFQNKKGTNRRRDRTLSIQQQLPVGPTGVGPSREHPMVQLPLEPLRPHFNERLALFRFGVSQEVAKERVKLTFLSFTASCQRYRVLIRSGQPL